MNEEDDDETEVEDEDCNEPHFKDGNDVDDEIEDEDDDIEARDCSELHLRALLAFCSPSAVITLTKKTYCFFKRRFC